jgi:DNA helicase-2/ATP-dependent DNA helicase PcrA
MWRRSDPPEPAALSEARRRLAALAGGADEAALRERVALSTEADFWDARAERVSLLTMHAAKGLEFPVVFVIGMEEGLVPFSFDAHGPRQADDREIDSLAEERRLFYVAMTRAKDRLFLTRAVRRQWRGRTLALPPSPFLRDIADELIFRDAPTAPKRRSDARQYSLF